MFGVFQDTNIDGFALKNPNNMSMRDIEIGSTNRAITSISSPYMCNFTRIRVSTSQTAGFDFSNASFKTSLSFDTCWVVNSSIPWSFNLAIYSTRTSCGADFCNMASGSPYGAGAIIGVEDDSRGVYHFVASSFTLNSVAAENCFGNGLINVNGGNSNLVINAPIAQNIRSSFDPDYISKPNFVMGPVQVGESGANVNVTASRPLDFENTYTTSQGKDHASVVAYNYTGAVQNNAVFVGPTTNTGVLIDGQNATNVRLNTFAVNDFKQNADIIESVRIGDTYTRSARPIGTGTIITIPFLTQSVARRAHMLKLMILEGDTSGTPTLPNIAAADVGCMSLTSLTGVQSGNLVGVASVARTGLNLEITLSVSVTDPSIRMDILSQNIALIDFDNISIA